MGDSENALPPSKKRVAGRQLSRDDDPDAEEDVSGQDVGTFQRASEEVLASRRIVKVRRNPTTSGGAANPFAALRLVPPPAPSLAAGETAAKIPEAILSAASGDHPSIVQEEDVPKAKDDTSISENPNEATEVPELNALDAAINENKGIPETKLVDANVNEDDLKDKEEVQLEPTKASKENGEETKDDPGESIDTKHVEAVESKEPNKEESPGEVPKVGTPEKEPSAAFNLFQQLSSTRNAFTGISGTGFSSSSFSFGLFPKAGNSNTVSFGSGFGPGSFSGAGTLGTGSLLDTKAPASNGSSSLSTSNGGASIQLFGGRTTDNVAISGSGLTALQEVPVETGEEKEKAVFTADAALFEYISGGWKERGKGELKVNVSSTETGKARLVMRSKGNYRLVLNANLFPDMKLTSMDKRGISFACMNSASESKVGLSTFALKFRDSSIVEEFQRAVEAHKGRLPGNLKTPENSPKASED